MSVGVAGVEFNGAFEMFLLLLKTAVHSNCKRRVGFRKRVVELECFHRCSSRSRIGLFRRKETETAEQTVSVGQAGIGQSRIGIFLQRFLEALHGLFHPRLGASFQEKPALQIELIDLRIYRRGAIQAPQLLSGHVDSDLLSDGPRHFVLQGQNVAQVAVVAPAPQVQVCSGVNQLRLDSHTSRRLHHRAFKNSKKPLSQIARELNVDGIVEGAVVQSAGRVRIKAQLIYARTDLYLWGRSYDRDLSDVLALEDEVARAITQEIRINVTAQELGRLNSASPVNPEVYQLYLKGRFFLERRTEAGMKKTVECFEEALQKDPNSALAYSGLADSYGLLGNFNFLPPKEAYPRAKAAAMKALEVDDTLAEAHAAFAHNVYGFEEREKHFKRAMELNPSYAAAHLWYSRDLSSMGRLDEALKEIQRAQESDPLSLIINDNVGEVYEWARQYDRAIEQLRKTLEMDPNFARTHLDLGAVYQDKGMFDEAIAEFQKEREVGGENWPELRVPLQRAYEASGYRGYYQEQLRLLKERSKRSYVAPATIAMIYARLGDKESAFTWLEKAQRERAGLFFIKVEPVYDPMRSDPRFRDLLHRAGLPE